MGQERKCILCDIVYNSKREMDEHMRSMLHHRELENLKGRDCGHKCLACGVSVVGLTEYANHISNPIHKQRVEAQQQERANGHLEEEYFDEELVRLIKKRKEMIRREEEEVRKAKDESERQKQQQARQQLLQHGMQWGSGYRRFPVPSKGCSISHWQGSGAEWSSVGRCQGWPRNWLPSHQARSATWHAGANVSFHTWKSVGPSGGSLRSEGQDKNQGYRGIHSQERGFEWGSRFHWEQTRGPLFEGMVSDLNTDLRSDNFPLLSAIHVNKEYSGQKERHQEWAEARQDAKVGHQKKENLAGDHTKARTSKPCSSNPKDKVNRWAPYPPAKCSDVLPWKESNVCLPEGCQVTPPGSIKDVTLNINLEQTTTHSDGMLRKGLKEKDRGSPSPQAEQGKDRRHRNSSSSQGDCVEPSSSSTQKARINLKKATSGAYSTSGSHHKISSQDCTELRSGMNSSEPLQDHCPNYEGQRHTGVIGKVKHFEDTSMVDHVKAVLLIKEELEAESIKYKANKMREETVKKKMNLLPMNKSLDSARHNPYTDEASRCVSIQTDCSSCTHSSSLQSIQVSTSTCDTAGDAASSVQDGEEKVEREAEEENDGDKLWDDLAKKKISTVDKGLGSDSEAQSGGQSQPRSGCEVPGLSKLGFPASLKRDLTRHIGHKSKAGVREPNLNIARRIRDISGTRRSETEKDTGLKPSLRQLISCAGSRRNVNWDQVYQEVNKKKQELGKRMPRFGIEMVAIDQCDQEEINQEEEKDITLTEGFHWESICASSTAFRSATPRKQASSEGTPAMDHTDIGLSQLPTATEGGDCPEPNASEGHSRGPCSDSFQISGKASIKVETVGDDEKRESADTVEVVQDPDSVEGYSSCASGPEQNDTQSTGKKRRAAGDVPSPEVPSLELKNKRRKIKSKKERSQVDQLLAVSLREEELNTSLEALDKSLVQARAALQVAYMEVQRLLVLKQQVTMEMSTLRSKRIEILQGIQGDYTGVNEAETGNTDNPASTSTKSALSSLFSPITTTASHFPNFPSPAIPTHLQQSYSPTASLSSAHPTSGTTTSSTTLPLPIKQEALPSCSFHPKASESSNSGLSSTALKPNHPTSNDPSQSSQSTLCLVSQSKAGLCQGSFGSKESVSVFSEHSQEGLRDSCSAAAVQCLADRHLEDSGIFTSLEKAGNRPNQAAKSASQRSSSTVVTDCTDLLGEITGFRTWLPCSPQPDLQLSPSSQLHESKSGKRVRKLKKKKALRRAPGDEHPDNSDTEEEGDTFRPIRKLKPRKKAKVSPGSTSPSGLKEEKEEVEVNGKLSFSRTDQVKNVGGNRDHLFLEMVELPHAKSHGASSIDSLSSNDGPVSLISALKKETSTKRMPQTPAAAKSESQTVACNEVTSTSELDGSIRVKMHRSKNQQPLSSEKVFRSGSDMSLELGDEEEPTEGSFEGHQAAISSMQIHGGLLYTCSGDRTVRAFDLVSRKCVAVFEGHTTKVNCLFMSSGLGLQHRLYTGSSDQTIRCYNPETQECQEQFSMADRVLCFHSRWKVLYAGLANGSVVSLSLKTNQLLDVFECHGPRAVSCLASAQEGTRRILLVGSYDCTVSVRDARSGLLLRSLEGHTKTVLCMKVVNDLVFSGSSDQLVHAYNIHTGELVRVYKGHSHAVTVVTILSKVMVTACLDKLVRVFDLQSHEQLQVYGGHKDMVTCMVVHKNMIYTGCYDGSVQAVRLNLIKNNRCWWHGCSMVFGVMEHLQQHLLTDHSSLNFQTLKCRWKNCDAFFSVRNNTKQDVPKHMQKHAEEDGKLQA
ncbi:zinc finger protein 106 isoform X1 [Scleropages formosus]|uniref:zinc finger protein 106 isoform X1 n=1 Tax=Scleropages formosus TaxID=113540 RepID=UPI0010FAC62F|nr:zinc finger protein 106 isoform X1 [Scleropages formosus]XP_018583324.2 zinc finger protein 106 isoform X1 [Scleropages formosus]XP_018583325.2 zinc finger protein 106 isoform X1 [Scleropages formosus]XP_018583326.2 zinc finger protein 106 isoform X1 [Scleropages formosus]